MASMVSSSRAKHENNLRLSVLEFIETERAYTNYLRILARSDFQQGIRTKCGQTFNTKRTFSESISTFLPQLLDWWSALLFLHEDLDSELQEKCFLRDRNKNLILTESGEKQMNPNSQTYLLSAFAKRAHFLIAEYAACTQCSKLMAERSDGTFDQRCAFTERKARGLNLLVFDKASTARM